KSESNKVFNRRKAQKIQKAKKQHECAKLIDLDKLGHSLSDVKKVIKPEYASPEIKRSSKYQKKHKGSPSTLCIEVNQNHKRFDDLKIHLPIAPNLNYVNDGIWPAWALLDNYNDANYDSKSNN
ncbi:42717_t:CDS:2, partial [Gigaspora margarita]